MAFLRKALVALILLGAALTAVAYFLPSSVVVERQIEIDAEPEAVFEQVSSLQNFTQWSPWQDRDPDMTVEFSGPASGVGNVMGWRSDEPSVGDGRQEIVELAENERVLTALEFGGMPPAEAWWVLSETDAGTQVTWGLDAQMGNNPINRWVGLMLDGMVGPDYDTGLANLKALVEG